MRHNQKSFLKRYVIPVGIPVLALLILAAVLFLGPFSRGSRYEKKYEAAQMEFLAGEYDKAISHLDEAMSIKETEEVYLLMAECHLAADKPELARNVLRLGDMKLKSPAIAAALEELETAPVLPSPPIGAPEIDSVSIGGQELRLDAKIVSVTQKGLTDLQPFTALTQLESLTLTDNQIRDLSPLESLTNLSYLQLSGNQISDLAPLKRLPALRTLYLDGNQISDLSPLESLKSLATLSLRDMVLDRQQLDRLKAALPDANIYCDELYLTETLTLGGETFQSDIKELTLGGRNITDISVLAKCTQLEKLDLRNNQISDLDALSGLSSLTWICLWNNEVTDVAALLPLSNLTYLDLDDNDVENLSPLKALALEELWLSSSRPKSLAPIADMKTLHRLGLKNTGLTEEDVQIICGLTGLKELSIERNEISAELLATLETALPQCTITHDEPYFTFAVGGDTYKSTETTSIQIQGPVTGFHSLEGLERFSLLTRLTATDNAIVDLSPLRELTELRYLSLGNYTAEGKNHFRDLSPLSGLTRLNTLLLPSCGVQDLSPLGQLTALRELDLSDNKLTDINALANLKSLQTLYLDRTGVADISALSQLPELVQLSLEGCPIEDLTPLYALNRLSLLVISSNDYSPEELDALREALPNCGIDVVGRIGGETHSGSPGNEG